MKKILSILAMLLPVITLSAKSPVLQIVPEELPQGVKQVYPDQGFVVVSKAENPNGVSNINVAFNSFIETNPDNTTPALLYFNDFSTAVDQTLFSSVNMETLKEGCVLFKRNSWNKTGIYKIEIPEGFWLYESSSLPTPAITLYYEIYIGYSLLPHPGVITDLSEIILNFNDADVVRTTGMGQCKFSLDNSPNEYSMSYKVVDYDNSGKENQVVFNVSSNDTSSVNITEPGTYMLTIDSGTFEYITYGPNYPADPEDYISRTNSYIIAKYDIPPFNISEIEPSPDEVQEYFDFFTIYFPEDMTVFMRNDKVHSNIFSVNDNGVVNDGSPLCWVVFNFDNNYEDPDTEEVYSNKMILTLMDPFTAEPLSQFTPTSGEYCLRLAPSLFSGLFKDNFFNSPAFDFYYVVKNSISGLMQIEELASSESNSIYTMSGIRIAKDADNSVIGSLPSGLYIINGKKVYVR